jgi:glucose dehydrogenase
MMGIGRLAAVISSAVPFFAAVPAHAQAQGNIAPAATAAVDDQRLRAAAADGDWITFGRDYSNQRFAPLHTIDRSNVAQLAPAWTYQLGSVGATQTHPLVVGGVMYVSMAGNDVAAIDAATGSEIWRYHHTARGTLPRVPSNRGVAVAYGHVFEATDDARVIAVDQSTGKLIWDKAVLPFDAASLVPAGQKKPRIEFVMRAAPLVYDGLVIIGATGFEANRFDDDFV